MTLVPDEKRIFLGHINPFGGKCIHGKDGAYLYKGSQVNPTCTHCKREGRDGKG